MEAVLDSCDEISVAQAVAAASKVACSHGCLFWHPACHDPILQSGPPKVSLSGKL